MAACVASEESQSKLSKIQSSRSKGKNVDKDAKKEIKVSGRFCLRFLVCVVSIPN